MEHTFWFRQTKDKPLFPDLLWSRPENKAYAGKLLIIGGNAQGFSAAAEAYQYAAKAGIGTARVALPDVLQKTIGKVFEAGEFVPSTPSGSFAQSALAELLAMSNWADGVLLAGELGRNSETAILLEKFVQKYSGNLTITKDAVDYFMPNPSSIVMRPDTTFVLSLAQLQKLASNAHFLMPFTFEMDMLRFVEALHSFTDEFQLNIIAKHLDTIFVSTRGSVSSTRLTEDTPIWRLKTAASAAVWSLQNPTRTFEALTTSLL